MSLSYIINCTTSWKIEFLKIYIHYIFLKPSKPMKAHLPKNFFLV